MIGVIGTRFFLGFQKIRLDIEVFTQSWGVRRL